MEYTKTNKRGISLIVLVITIIVIIILAAAVILTISQNNPVENAKEATLKSDIKTMQEELLLLVSEELLEENGYITRFNGAAENNLTAATKYPGLFQIENGKLLIDSLAANELQKNLANEMGIGKVKLTTICLGTFNSKEFNEKDLLEITESLDTNGFTINDGKCSTTLYSRRW